MNVKESEIQRIVKLISLHCHCFGGGSRRSDQWNPLSQLLRDQPPMFAAGVDVEEIVRLVIFQIKEPLSLSPEKRVEPKNE